MSTKQVEEAMSVVCHLLTYEIIKIETKKEEESVGSQMDKKTRSVGSF
jgi:hypothetical protein